MDPGLQSKKIRRLGQGFDKERMDGSKDHFSNRIIDAVNVNKHG